MLVLAAVDSCPPPHAEQALAWLEHNLPPGTRLQLLMCVPNHQASKRQIRGCRGRCKGTCQRSRPLHSCQATSLSSSSNSVMLKSCALVQVTYLHNV